MTETVIHLNKPTFAVGEVRAGGIEDAPLLSQSDFDEMQGLALVGQLSDAVAHELNNSLSAVLIQLGLLINDPALTSVQKELVKTLAGEGARAADLSRRLLSFARTGNGSVDVFDLNPFLADLLKTLTWLLRGKATVRSHLSLQECGIRGDAALVEKMLLSLFFIIRDVASPGSELTLTTNPDFVAAKRADDSFSLEGDFVCLLLTVSSLKQESLTNLEKGKGDFGWKMIAAQKIVSNHGGWIDVHLEKPSLAFRVFLPKESNAGVLSESAADPRGTETILLIEDETFLRRVSAQSLRKLGYAVLDGADGEQADKLWQRQHHKIDLLLTDLMLPGSESGEELALRLMAEKPTLKVMLMSGSHVELKKIMSADNNRVFHLSKPYDSSILAKSVRGCLDTEI